MSRFTSPLRVEYRPQSKDWILTRTLTYKSQVLDKVIQVPKGSTTDFASVPRVPIAYWLAGGRAQRPAVIHDYLYRLGAKWDGDRALADAVFLEAMEAEQTGWLVRRAMWLGVRVGGWRAWNRYRST